MPLYLNNNKYVGGYQNGQRINGYINGIKMFVYSTNVQINFSHGGNQTLSNVSLGNHDVNDLKNYGLNVPNDYGFSDDDSYNITPNCTINVNDYLLTTTVTVNFSNGSNQTLYNVPLGNQDLNNFGLSAPTNYNLSGTTTFNITSNCSVSVDVAPQTTTVYVNFSSGGSQTLYNVPFGSQDLSNYGLSIPTGYYMNGNASFFIMNNSSVTVNTAPNQYTATINFANEANYYAPVGTVTATVYYGNSYNAAELAQAPSGYKPDPSAIYGKEKECTGDMNFIYLVKPTQVLCTANYYNGSTFVGSKTTYKKPGTYRFMDMFDSSIIGNGTTCTVSPYDMTKDCTVTADGNNTFTVSS